MPTGYQIMSKVKEWQESDKWGYLFGASGQKFTRDVYEQFLALAEGDSERKEKVEEAWEKYAGRNVADCSGIVYRAMRECGMSVERFYTGSIPWASGSPYKIVYRKDEHGNPSEPTNIPNEPGIVLWREGHMALLVDLDDDLPTVTFALDRTVASDPDAQKETGVATMTITHEDWADLTASGVRTVRM